MYDELPKIFGDSAEDEFTKFLDEQNIPFLRIIQSKYKKSFSISKALTDKNYACRPDFTIYTKNEIFHIDVKKRYKNTKDNRFITEFSDRFYLWTYEIKELFCLQNKIQLPVWLAFTDSAIQCTFFYASISSINEFYLKSNELLKNKYSNTYEKFKYNCKYIFIPEVLLYNDLSFEKGFCKKLNEQFFETEAEYLWKNYMGNT